MRLLGLWWLPLLLSLSSPATAAVYLTDLLSSSPHHQLLLAAFQRARLIPTLNRLNGSALLAPTDEAIRRERDREQALSGWSGEAQEGRVWSNVVDWVEAGSPVDYRDKPDNLQLALRDTLLYHVFNFTLFPPPANSSSSNSSDSTPSDPSPIDEDSPRDSPLPFDIPTLQETLYYPSLFPYNRSFPAPPSLPGSPPDKLPKKEPQDRPEGLLHGEGQKVRIIRKKRENETWVGVDWKGAGGVKAAGETLFAQNGALVSIDGVLQKPKDLGELVRSTSELSVFASLLPPQVLDYLTTVSHLTLFAPTNEAWGILSDLEMRYLRSGFAELDIAEIFGDVASRSGAGRGRVGYLERLVGSKGENKTEVTTLRNATLELTGGRDATEASVNGTAVITGDILAKNGVLHIVPSLLLPSGSLYLTAEKYLIALNATRFVSLLRSVNLSHYVQVPSRQPGTILESMSLPPIPSSLDIASQHPLSAASEHERERYTILAVRDDVLAPFLASRGLDEQSLFNTPVLNGHPLPPEGSAALKELLAYHIVAGSWRPSDLKDGFLLGTELRTELLRGSRQRIAVGVQGEHGNRGEGWESRAQGKKKKGEERDADAITWGGATVVAEPVAVGGSIIYLVSSLIDPPSSVVTAAVTDLRLSTFVASVYAAALDGTLSMQPAVTYLVPTNDAFGALGLTMSYLLLPSSRSELRSVLRYHAVDEVVYLDEFPKTGGTRYATLLDGAEIYLATDPVNGTLSVHGPTLGGLPANGDIRDSKVIEGDILTETGVIHIVDQVELPAALDITLEKLLLGAKANTMVELIKLANMSWVLEGKRQPRPEHDDEDGDSSVFSSVSDESKDGRKHDGRFADTDDRAYTILCPTDKALSRLNLTYYRTHPSALESLIRLHVIPGSSDSSPLFASSPAEPGAPLLLEDARTYSTLLSKMHRGGTSNYGSVAFRKWGDGESSWLVGVEGATGAKGQADAARVLAWGKATPWFVDDRDDARVASVERAYAETLVKSTRLAPAGGVISIDAVLLPFEPGWFRRFGWIVVSALVGVLVLALVGSYACRKYKKRREAHYQRVLAEEDDD